MSRVAAEARGRSGETIAAWWLRLHGWRILDRRKKSHVGEIDLIARRGRILAFVEVKTRRRGDDAELAIDHARLRRVAAAAEMMAPRYARDGDDIRIDVILVVSGRLPRHLTNVWHG